MKAGRTLVCIILSLFMVLTMMPSGFYAAFAEGEEAAEAELLSDVADDADAEDATEEPEEESENDADTDESVSEGQQTSGEQQAADQTDEGRPEDAVSIEPEGSEKDSKEDAGATLSITKKTNDSSVKADEEFVLTVKAVNKGENASKKIEARIYFWDYDIDFFDKDKTDKVKKVNKQVTVRDLGDDDTVKLKNDTSDTDVVELELVTKNTVRYLSFDVPAGKEYKFDLPLVLEEDPDQEESQDTVRVIVDPEIEGQDDGDAAKDAVDVQWDAPETGDQAELQTDGSEDDAVESSGISKLLKNLLKSPTLKAQSTTIATETISADLSWEIIETDGEYELVFTGSGTIPANFYNRSAFSQYKTTVTKITIPAEITSIGANAFQGMNAVKEVEFLKGDSGVSQLKTIGASAFASCSKLAQINLEDTSLETIGNNAFQSTSYLTQVTFPDSLKSIGTNAFKDADRLKELVIPSGVETVSGNAFYNLDSLEKVIFLGGSTIANNAFYNCRQLRELVFSDSGDNSTLVINASAFYYSSNINTVTIDHANTDLPASLTSIFAKNTQYIFGDHIDTLDGDWFNNIVKVSDVTFSGPNDLTITKAEGSGSSYAPFSDLEGDYYVDSYGCLYKLNDDNTASLIYVSPGETSYCTVPAEITTVAGEKYTVAEIGPMAFAKADNLTSLIIEEPSNVSIEARAFTESNITTVNNADKIDPDDYKFVSTACDFPLIEEYQDAKMVDELMTSVPLEGTDEDGNPAMFHFSVQVSEGPLGKENGVYEYLTGQSATFTVAVDNRSNIDLQDRVVRIYFAFTGDEYAVGNYSIGKNYTVVNQETGAEFPMSVVQTDQPGIFYYDIKGWRPGDTLAFRNAMLYNSPQSAGGNLYVWSESLEADEAEKLKGKVTEPDEYLKLHWGTNPIDFTTKKTLYYDKNKYSPSYSVDGTADSDIYVNDYLSWTLTMNSGTDTNKTQGKDYVCYVDYSDTVQLPSDLIWDPKVIEAIQNGKYRFYTSSTDFAIVYVTVDGTERQLLAISQQTNKTNFKNVKISVEEDAGGKSLVTVRWRKENTTWQSSGNDYPTSELANQEFRVTISNNNIMVDRESQLFKILKGKVESTSETEKYIKQASVINNHTEATRHYSYSGDKKTENDAPVMNIKVPSGLTMTKDRPRPDDSYYAGGKSRFTITVTNTGVIADRQIGKVEDELHNLLYIMPDNITAMFDNEQFGEYLEIEISPATLCSVVDETVTDVQGNEAQLVSQNTGVDVPYNGCASTDDSVITTNAKLSLSRNADKQIVLKVDRNGDGSDISEYVIGDGGDYGTVQKAFDSIGYVVTFRTRYKVTWNLPSDFVIYGGQKVQFDIPANLKQTTMLLERDNPGSYYSDRLPWNNYAYAYGHDGTTLIKQAYTSGTLYKELSFDKYATYNGENVQDDIDIVNHTSVDYTLSFVNYKKEGDSWVEHYTAGTYDVLPVVDKMQGSQCLLVKASELAGATWQETSDSDTTLVSALDLPTYVEGGTTYYVINKPGIYKKLKTGTNVTDTVTVTKTSSGFETFIRWYFTDVTPQLAARTVKYKVLVDASLAGTSSADEEDADTKLYISNESWLGDHQTHRLYDSVGGSGRLISFSKKILEDDGSTTDHSIITDGDEVTYKITLENTSDSEMVIDGSHMYDDLPSTAGIFAWSKENVTSITYEPEETGSECLTPGEEYWEVNSTQPGTGADTADSGQYYIHWNDDFKIKFGPKGKVNIIVKLKFPGSADVTEDGDPDNSWDDFIKKVAGGSIYNIFYFDGVSSSVSHELADQAEAVLKKGVYDTGWVRTTYSSSQTGDNNSYASHESRWYYQNGNGLSGGGACITYYAVLYNSGNVRLYLDDLQDTLPKGFHYSSMADQDVTSGKTGSWYSWPTGYSINKRVLYSGNAYKSKVDSIDTESDVDTNNGNGSRASYKLVTVKDGSNAITYVNANVTMSKKSGSDTEHLTFKVVSPKGSGSEGPVIHYDSDTGKYYLNPGEALRFGYNCYVDKWRNTDDSALNAISMPFYDKYGLGLRMNETASLTARKKLSMADNNGDSEIISNAEAVSIYGHTGKNDSTEWLSSNVTVYRQNIAPGIKKTVGGVSPVSADLDITETTVLGSKYSDSAKYGNTYSGTTSFSDIINWKLVVYNESPYIGENSMSEFTITDKVDAPYAFTGQVFYKITGPNNSATDRSGAYIPLFTLGARSEGDTQVRIAQGANAPNSANKDTITVNGDPKVYGNFSVQLLRDEEGCETLIIKFINPTASYYYPIVIPGDGKMELCVHTQYNSSNSPLSSTLYNSAVLMPEQTYDSTLVSQGKPLLNEDTGENEGIQSGASVTITTGFASTASKTVTEIGNEKNTANSENDTNYISLNDTTKSFRYDLIVNGPENDPMSKLLVIDSLPEEGDHSPFVDRDKRDSEFKVSMLSDDPGFSVSVIANAGKGTATVLEDSQYTIEVSERTDFEDDDWKGRGDGWNAIDLSDGLSDEETALIEKARSIRIIIDDDTVATMPANSRVKISFNANIDGETNPGETAWNSFGYSYTVPVGSTKITLNAEPEKAGVHIPSIPRIVKDVVDEEGNTTNVARDYPFEAIIYTGAPIESLNDITEKETEDIATILANNNRKILYVPLTVLKGESSYDTGYLDEGYAYTYDEESSEWVRTATAWNWTNGQQYTVLELISPNERGYEVQSIVGNMKNNTGFTYNSTIRLRIGVINRFTDYKADLTIAKTCDGYYDGGEESNLSFGFKIVGVDQEGKETYTNFAALTFNKGDSLTKTVTIPDVPINLDVTVEEVYSGDYTVSGDAAKTAKYDRKNNLWTVSFENTHKDTNGGSGSGVVNKYEDNKFKEQQGLGDPAQ